MCFLDLLLRQTTSPALQSSPCGCGDRRGVLLWLSVAPSHRDSGFQRQIRSRLDPPPKTENYQRILDSGPCQDLCWRLGAGAVSQGPPQPSGESDNESHSRQGRGGGHIRVLVVIPSGLQPGRSPQRLAPHSSAWKQWG